MELTVRVVDTEAGFFALESEWNELQERSATASIFTTFEWSVACWSYNDWGEGAQPFIMKLYDGQQLVGLAPLCQRKRGLRPVLLQPIGIGYAWLADYTDVISAQGYEQAVLASMFGYLKGHPAYWDTFDWHELSEASPSYQALASASETAGLRYVAVPENTCHVLDIPSTWDEFLAGLTRNTRRKIVRKTNKFERECAGRVRQIETAEEIDAVLVALHEFQDRRWPSEDAEGRAAYMGFIRQLAPLMLERGWLDLRALYAGDDLVAMTLHFRFADKVYAFLTAYDPDERWDPYSVGTLLLADSIKHSIEDGYRVYDQGRGDEEYKVAFGGSVYHNYRVRIVHTPVLYLGYHAGEHLKHFGRYALQEWKHARHKSDGKHPNDEENGSHGEEVSGRQAEPVSDAQAGNANETTEMAGIQSNDRHLGL